MAGRPRARSPSYPHRGAVTEEGRREVKTVMPPPDPETPDRFSPSEEVDDPISRFRKRQIRYQHDHPPVRNINEMVASQLTVGDRVADRVAATMGSWPFLIGQSILLSIWVLLNVVAWIRHWDPYPFILLNLGLSMQAAYAAPILMMSQNRLAVKDRLMAQQDYEINMKAEEEIKVLMHHLEGQHEMMLQLLQQLEEQQVHTRRLVGNLDAQEARSTQAGMEGG